jgi:NAD(P)-dependent dehydrogenase (short-subunit alcohol dehydrogenase family)
MGERLKGKVAIVTGSGRGIGRAHALALAAEGAKVVVNDVGAERSGTGSSRDPADQVASEIRSRGGEAVANYDSVAEFDAARRIVQTALDQYGRLDILVNNAGVFWHFLIHEMSEEAWDRVIGVHLKGSFNMCRHAAPIMMKQRYGRIINTTSSQWRNPEGRANYGAAKGGIVSLTWDLAFELRDYGITVNAVAPFANTRRGNAPQSTQAETLRRAGLSRKKPADEQGDERATPEFVSPIVVYLATDQAANVNGLVFRAGGGKIGLYSHPTEQATICRDWRKDGPWTMDDLEKLLPGTLLSGLTQAPFIPGKKSDGSG